MTDSLEKHGFHHVFEPGDAGAPPILLLHGTGGNEKDLVPLTRHLAPESPILSVRGKVLENGMPRYFRRFAEGVFDLEDLRFRTDELLAFIRDAIPVYGLTPGRLVILGYSNGANIGTNLIFAEPRLFAGGILMRPMVTHELEAPLPDLSGKEILLLGGDSDPIAPADEITRLAAQFTATGASVTPLIHPNTSHGLTQADFKAAMAKLRQFAAQ
jgi:predicted esterase